MSIINFGKRIDLGLLIIRVGLGVLFVYHGWPKITGGPETWAWLGKALSSYGITFIPEFFGLIAALSEFLGGTLLILGLFSRTAALFMFGTMAVAVLMHIGINDPFQTISHPLKAAIAFLGLVFTGPGKYSLDTIVFKKE